MERPDIPDDTPPNSVVILDADAYRAQRKTIRRQVALLVACVVIALASVVYTQYQVIQNQDESATRGKQSLAIAKDVKKTLDILTNATSPEAQAAQQAQLRAAIQAAIQAIGCDNRAALQDLLDQLIQRGILTPGDATIACTSSGVPPTTTPEGN